MRKNFNYSGFILLNSFTAFPEYFVGISAVYVLIAVVLITHNVYGLMVQKTLSECIALILLMTCYLIFNDDLLFSKITNCLIFNGSYASDYIAYTTKIVICFFSALYFLLIANSLKEQKLTSFEYLLITLFAVLGFMLMCSSYDFLTAYLSIELSSLSLYILASFKKTSTYSIDSGLKYFVTGSISSAFFLLGVSYIYVDTGTINFQDLYYMNSVEVVTGDLVYLSRTPLNSHIVSDSMWRVLQGLYGRYLFEGFPIVNQFDPIGEFAHNLSFYELGLVLIILSLFIKLAAAPFHLWSLDVYEGSPTVASFFFATISKFSIFVLLLRLLFYSAHESLHYNWPFYFFGVGFLSVFIGSLGGLQQRKLKTLLAYSSITNMGYALLAFGTNSVCGIQAVCIHLIIYMLSSLCVWSIFLLLRLKTVKISNKYSKELCDLALLRKSNPAMAFALTLTMFSISGIPPLVGFLSKMGVFFSLVTANVYFFAVVSASLSVSATFYYIRVVKVVYFENLLVGKLYHPINSSSTIILSVLIFLLVYLFIDPSILYLISHKIMLKRLIGVPLTDELEIRTLGAYSFFLLGRLKYLGEDDEFAPGDYYGVYFNKFLDNPHYDDDEDEDCES